MSQQSVTPLGDSVFVDLGQSSLNSFGVDLPYLTDQWGGDVPANIPNPLASFDTYDPEPSVFLPYVPYIPPPTVCVVGCDPITGTPPDVMTPEPSAFWMLGAGLVLFILFVDKEGRRSMAAITAICGLLWLALKV